jgi:hypothetical protein
VAKRRQVPEQPEQLVARVVAIDPSYFLMTKTLGNDRRANEEAILNLTGKICWISRRHKQHLGREIDISLISSQQLGVASSEAGYSDLFQSRSRAAECTSICRSFYRILPFIKLDDCMVDLDFEPTKWGHGQLRSISISPLRQLLELPGFPDESLVGGDLSAC